MEILVLHPGAIGDIVLSLPALKLLREQHPGTLVTLAGNLDYLALVPASCADRRLSLATLPLQKLYGSLPLPESDVEFWNSFDSVVSWTGAGDERYGGNLRAIHPRVLIAPWRPARGERRHVAQVFADSLSPWVRRHNDVSPVEIRPDPSQMSFADQWLADRGCEPGTKLLALQPGGGGLSKRWPFENFIRLARKLLQNEIERLLVIEGPAEPGLGRKVAEILPASGSVVAECLPLDRLAALLFRCRAYVGNDSGITHLAAAVGIHCIALFGPTSPEQWAPLGPEVIVLRDVSGCSACANGQSGGHQCLENLSPDLVLRALVVRKCVP